MIVTRGLGKGDYRGVLVAFGLAKTLVEHVVDYSREVFVYAAKRIASAYYFLREILVTLDAQIDNVLDSRIADVVVQQRLINTSTQKREVIVAGSNYVTVA